MGNSKSDVDIAITLDKEFYFAGETVNGRLYINAKKKYSCSMIVLFIEGTESCQFTSEQNQQVKGFKRLINTNYILQQFSHNYFLEGQLVFPFCFKFLQYLPGSYSESKAFKAEIKYIIKAVVNPNLKNTPPLQKVIDIIIRQPQREGERMLYQQSFSKCKSCFCLDKGQSRVACYFQKNYYFPGDQCKLICQIDNLRCGLDVSIVNCQFIKEVTLTALNGAKKKFSEILNVVQFEGIAAGGSYFGLNSKNKIIKLIYRDSLKGVHPSTKGNYVKCQYFIQVKPQFGGCFNKVQDSQFRVELNILQAAMQYQHIVQPQVWRPSISENTNIFLDFNEKNDLLSSMSDKRKQSQNRTNELSQTDK